MLRNAVGMGRQQKTVFEHKKEEKVMDFSSEQLEMLHEGFRKHDITKDVSLTKESRMPDEQKKAYGKE